MNMDIDEKKDYLTFRFYNPKNNGSDYVKVVIQEDDNDDGIRSHSYSFSCFKNSSIA